MDSRVGRAFGKYTISRLLGKGGMGEVYEAYDNEQGTDRRGEDPRRRVLAQYPLFWSASSANRERQRFCKNRTSFRSMIGARSTATSTSTCGSCRDRRSTTCLRRRRPDAVDAVNIIGRSERRWTRHTPKASSTAMSTAMNIIVKPADFAYLVDFGIAATTGDTKLTTAGTKIGTLNYMAPDRFTDRPATHAVDVYSLACVLYESLTGEAPCAGDSLEHLLAAHVSLPPPRPTERTRLFPQPFDDVIARGMAKDPDDRYGTARPGLGRAALRALDSGQPTAATAMPTMVPTEPTNPMVRGTESVVQQRKWLLPAIIAVTAALVLGAIAVVIGILAQPDSETSTAPAGNGAPIVTGPDQSKLHQSCDQDRTACPRRVRHSRRARHARSVLFLHRQRAEGVLGPVRQREPAAAIGVGARRRRPTPSCPAPSATVPTS